MKKLAVLMAFGLLLLAFGSTNAWANGWTLWDYDLYQNGSTLNPPGPPFPSNINTAGFDFSTGLGSIVFTFNTPGVNTAGIYLYPFFDAGFGDTSGAYGTVNGALPAGVSYGMAWPGVPDGGGFTLWDYFAANALGNTNSVSAYSAPPDACCSVAIAELFGFNLGSGQTATLIFNVTTSNPGGFNLQIADHDSGNSIYVSQSLRIGDQGVVPEPVTIVTLSSGAVMLFFSRRKLMKK